MRVKSPAKRSPPKIGTPIPDEDHGIAKFDDNRGLELQIVDPAVSYPIARSFELPDGWIVEAKPRWNNPSHVDKTYREPGTGRQFRSLVAVQRYLSGEPETIGGRKPVKRALDYCVYENSSVYENSLQIVSRKTGYITDGAAYNLPDGWVVEHIPRRKGQTAGTIDRYYIEPGTGYRLRSLRSVERYLAEIRESSNASKNSISQKKNMSDDSDDDKSWDMVLKSLVDEKRSNTAHVSKPTKANTSQKKLKSIEEANNPMPNFSSPPEKVKWVLGGPGNLWNPFMGESEVPENVQHTWSETFISSMEGRFKVTCSFKDPAVSSRQDFAFNWL